MWGNFFKSYEFFLYLKPFCKKTIYFSFKLIYFTQDLVCICNETKNFFTVLSVNSSETEKGLPVKASKPNLVIFVVYSGNSL